MKTTTLSALAVLCLFSPPLIEQVEAQTRRYVCAAGVNCDAGSTHGAGTSYSSINAAIDVSVSGDTIYLKAGETFDDGTIFLDDKGPLASPITIRSSGPDSCFPAAGVRAVPLVRRDGRPLPAGQVGNVNTATCMAHLGNPGNINTITTSGAAQDYVLRFLHFYEVGSSPGTGQIVRFGTNLSSQQFVSQQPRDLVVDRSIFEPHHLVGGRLGVLANAANVTVENSYFTNFVGFQDTSCVAISNTTGPHIFRNNYCEAGGENFLTGGDDAQMRTFVNTAAGSTTSTIHLNASTFRNFGVADAHDISTLSVGQHVAIRINTLTSSRPRHSYVATIVDADTFTIDPPIDLPPAEGSDVRWGVTTDDIVVERNHLVKRLEWQNAILASPTGVTATALPGAGTLAAGTYNYKVYCRKDNSYGGGVIGSLASTQVSATLDATGSIRIDWSACETGITQYRVWRLGAQNQYFQVNTGTHTYTDTGSAGTIGTPPTIGTSGVRWTNIKNNFELKMGTNVIVRYNILENSFFGQGGGGAGLCMWIKSVNQDGNTQFFQTKDIYIGYNVCRHMGGFVALNSQETCVGCSAYREPGPLENVTIEHNLIYDSGNALGGSNQAGLSTGYNGVTNLIYRNNTNLHDFHAAWKLGSRPPWPNHVSGSSSAIVTVKDNIFIRGQYGITADSPAEGTTSINTYWPGGVFLNNIVSGANSANYPATTITPSTANLQSAFVDYGGTEIEDYAIAPGHLYRTGSSTGGLIGADVAQLILFTNGVVQGTPSGAPTILTESLPGGTDEAPYSVQLTSSGGTGAKTWGATGLAGTGVSLSTAGLLAGTPTTPGTYPVVVTVTDSVAASHQRTFSLVIAAATATLSITTTTLPNCEVNAPSPYSHFVNATGGTGAYLWSVSIGQLPTGLLLNTTSGEIAGVCTVTGPYNFTLRVTSGAATPATQQYTVTATQTTTTPGQPQQRPSSMNGVGIFIWATTDPPTVDPDNPRNSPRAKDFSIGDDIIPRVITDPSTTPVTMSGIGAYFFVTLWSHPTAITLTDAAADPGVTFGTDMFPIVDLSQGATRCRVQVNQVGGGSSGSRGRVQYTINAGVDWFDLGCDVNTESNAAKVGTYGTMAAAALVETVRLRFRVNGNGAADPAFRFVAFEFK